MFFSSHREGELKLCVHNENNDRPVETDLITIYRKYLSSSYVENIVCNTQYIRGLNTLLANSELVYKNFIQFSRIETTCIVPIGRQMPTHPFWLEKKVEPTD